MDAALADDVYKRHKEWNSICFALADDDDVAYKRLSNAPLALPIAEIQFEFYRLLLEKYVAN